MLHTRDLPEGTELPDTPEVRAALDDPATLITAAHTANPDWSVPYGGPHGVAILTGLLRERLDTLAREMTALRSVATAEMLRSESLADVGHRIGLGKSAVHKLNKMAPSSRFVSLLTRGTW